MGENATPDKNNLWTASKVEQFRRNAMSIIQGLILYSV